MNLSLLTDEELVRYADVMQDPLTTTELESVLIGRFEALLDEHAQAQTAITVLDDFGMDTTTTKGVEQLTAALQFAFDHDHNLARVRAVLDLGLEHDIDTVEGLKARLELADQFDQVREDASSVIADLNKIFNPDPATT